MAYQKWGGRFDQYIDHLLELENEGGI